MPNSLNQQSQEMHHDDIANSPMLMAAAAELAAGVFGVILAHRRAPAPRRRTGGATAHRRVLSAFRAQTKCCSS
jgi:hypothetical protein